MRRRGDTVPVFRSLTTLTVTAILVAACSGGDDGGPPPTVVTTTTEAPQPRVDDGVLRIGALIPSSDTAIGPFLTGSVTAAIDAVNEAGGVLGSDVELVIADEGSSAVTAASAIESLVEDGVDAIIGPTSSNNAIGALDEAVTAGVVTCSATATAIALDDYPDDELFFRSIATDSLQAIAIAGEAQATGAGNVAIVHTDDAYGRPYADAVADALGGSISIETIPVPVDGDDLTEELDVIATTGPQVVVVLGSGEDTARFLEAMGQRDDLTIGNIIVNDAARSATSRPIIAGLPSTLRNRIVMVAPQIVLPDSADLADNPPFGSQVIECVNLLALSAMQGDSDNPAVIAGQMSSVSDGGERCTSFAACAQRLADDQQIDYDGPTGITDLGRNGDPSRAFFDRFRFTEDGSDMYERSSAVRS